MEGRGDKEMHALVVGGTGMLKHVSVWLVEQGFHVSVIGRNAERLEKLKALCKEPEKVTSIAIDYHNSEALRIAVRNTVEDNGPISLAVAWIRSTAPEAIAIIGEEVEACLRGWELVHILGSSAYKKGNKEVESNLCNYRSIILGFIVEGEKSRWLTHSEISKGVIQGIQSKEPKIIVGTLEPWGLRPR